MMLRQPIGEILRPRRGDLKSGGFITSDIYKAVIVRDYEEKVYITADSIQEAASIASTIAAMCSEGGSAYIKSIKFIGCVYEEYEGSDE